MDKTEIKAWHSLHKSEEMSQRATAQTLETERFKKKFNLLKLLKPKREWLNGNLLIRTQKIFFRCIYVISLYKEIIKGNEHIRFEAYPLKKLQHPESLTMSIPEICEILDFWENSEVYTHIHKLIKHLDIQDEKIIISKKSVSKQISKLLVYNTVGKLNTKFNFDIFYYEVEGENMKESILIEVESIEAIPIHSYLCLSKGELANILRIKVEVIPENYDKISDYIYLSNSNELCINQYKHIQTLTENNISESPESHNENNDSENAPLRPKSPIKIKLNPNHYKIHAIILSDRKYSKIEKKAAETIQKFYKRKMAIELKKLLVLKRYRESRYKLLCRSIRYIGKTPYMISVYSSKKGILVKIQDMNTRELYEKLIDPSFYIFGYSQLQDPRLIVDALEVINGKPAFLRNYSGTANIDVQIKDYSFFEHGREEGLSYKAATLIIQRFVRVVIAKRLLIRKRKESQRKLVIHRAKIIGDEEYMVSIFEAPNDYTIEVYSVHKPKTGEWKYAKTFPISKLKKMHKKIDGEVLFREVQIIDNELVLVRSKRRYSGDSLSSFVSITDENLILSRRRVLNFKKCVVKIGLDTIFSITKGQETEILIFDVTPVVTTFSRKQLSVDLKMVCSSTGIQKEWIVPLSIYLLDNCLQVGEFSINLNLDVPKLNLNEKVNKIQKFFRGWRVRKSIGKIHKHSEHGLIAMKMKEINGKKYIIYAYAQSGRIKIEAEHGREIIAMYLGSDILKVIGDTTRKKFLEEKILPNLGIHDQGIIRKLYYEKRYTPQPNIRPSTKRLLPNINLSLSDTRSPATLLNASNTQSKNLLRLISLNETRNELSKLEKPSDALKRKKYHKHHVHKSEKEKKLKEESNITSFKSLNVSPKSFTSQKILNGFFSSKPKKLLLKTITSIQDKQYVVSLLKNSKGILVEAVDSKNKILSLQLETSINLDTSEEVLKKIYKDILARLYIGRKNGAEILALGEGSTANKINHSISNKNFWSSKVKHDRSATAQTNITIN
ncbi:unnamed protein product [Blepharisma stoltei]|uniref:Uncharacterized protein n=1 Tax=Blepharisma stoltei TaxID=1481888 RepID=A0AAU9IG89_9CILI|nr:unnamed protein product [Blepharisma stoltei]